MSNVCLSLALKFHTTKTFERLLVQYLLAQSYSDAYFKEHHVLLLLLLSILLLKYFYLYFQMFIGDVQLIQQKLC